MTDDFDPIANMERIREYTMRTDIVPLHDITHLVGDKVTVDCIRGTCYAVKLFYHPELASVKVELSENTIICEHAHGELEILYVLEGEMFQELVGNIITIAHPGEILIAPPNITHKHYCVYPTKLISITIPASEGYPSD